MHIGSFILLRVVFPSNTGEEVGVKLKDPSQRQRRRTTNKKKRPNDTVIKSNKRRRQKNRSVEDDTI